MPNTIVLPVKDKLNVIEAFSKALNNFCITHNIFVLMHSALREYDEIKEAIKNSKTSVIY